MYKEHESYNPGAAEIPDNRVDDDCNPATRDSNDQAHIDFINDLNNNLLL